METVIVFQVNPGHEDSRVISQHLCEEKGEGRMWQEERRSRFLSPEMPYSLHARSTECWHTLGQQQGLPSLENK